MLTQEFTQPLCCGKFLDSVVLGGVCRCLNIELGGGFKYLLFSSLLVEVIQFHSYFSDGLAQPPGRKEPPTPTPGKIGNRAGLVPLKQLSEVPVPNDDLTRKMTGIRWYAVRLFF